MSAQFALCRAMRFLQHASIIAGTILLEAAVLYSWITMAMDSRDRPATQLLTTSLDKATLLLEEALHPCVSYSDVLGEMQRA